MPFVLNRTKTTVSSNLQRLLNGELSPLLTTLLTIYLNIMQSNGCDIKVQILEKIWKPGDNVFYVHIGI